MYKIVQELVKHNIIDKNKANTYIYGFEVLMIKFIVLAITIVLSFVFRTIDVLLLFLLLFVPLRKYAGGIHANNKYVCMSLSIIILGVIQAGYKYIMLNCYISGAIVILCAMIITIFSPGESEKHVLKVEQRKKYKHMSWIACSINVILFAISLWLRLRLIQYVSCMSLMLQGLLLIPLIFSKKKGLF